MGLYIKMELREKTILFSRMNVETLSASLGISESASIPISPKKMYTPSTTQNTFQKGNRLLCFKFQFRFYDDFLNEKVPKFPPAPSIFYCLLKENNRIKGKVKYSIVISLMVTYLISIFYFKANMLAILMVSVTPFIFLFLIHAFYKPFVKNK